MSTISLTPERFLITKFNSGSEPLLHEYYDAVGIYELENILRERISEYLAKPKGSYQNLALGIRATLIRKFEDILSEDELQAFLKRRALSHTYIWKFHKKKESVCIIYMNTLANYLGVKFVLMNFDCGSSAGGYDNG